MRVVLSNLPGKNLTAQLWVDHPVTPHCQLIEFADDADRANFTAQLRRAFPDLA